MKFLISILLMALLSLALSLFLPWWIIAPACFATSLLMKLRPAEAFLAGFGALSLLWGGMAWYISSANEHILAHRISLLILNQDNPVLLAALTAIIGGLTGGFSSLAGSLFPKRQPSKS